MLFQMSSATLLRAFEYAASTIIKKPVSASSVWIRRFRCFFGVTPLIAAEIWVRLNVPSHSFPKHLLFALLFLKRYDAEHVNASVCDVDEQTFRKWCWFYVEQMASLKVVRFVVVFYSKLIFRLIGVVDFNVVP